MDTLEPLFQQTASRINLSRSISQLAWESYSQVYRLDEELYTKNATEWFAVHIYLAILEQNSSSQHPTGQSTRVTVTLLLNISKMHCEEFLRKLKLTMEHKLPSPLTSGVVNDLVRDYVLTAALYDKCSRIFSDIFVEEADAVGYVEPNYHRLLCDQKKTVWLFYLLAKEKTSFDMNELITAFYILLCSFVPAVKSTPQFLLKSHWGSLEQSDREILLKLCTDYKADWIEVFTPIYMSDQWTQFVMKYDSLSPHAIVKDWHTIERSLCVDGLDFIEAPQLMVPTKVTSGGESSGIQVHPTPVQCRLNTIQHLKSMVVDFSDRPSDTLVKYFQCCEENPEEEILLRLNEMRDRYVNGYLSQHPAMPTVYLPTAQPYGGHRPNDIPAHRFSLIRKLYLRVLQSLLKQEEDRLSRTDFSTLLHIDTFHRSIVTCCTLVVNHTYNEQISVYDGLIFILETYNIEAYHMCKVIECFIKVEPELSKLSVQHLKSCENHILDNLAWRHSSALYDVLPTANQVSGQTDAAAQNLPNEAGPVGAAQFLTPTCRRVTGRPFAENGQQPRSHSLSMFMKKVCRLAYHRLQLLCNSLTIPRDVIPKIWTCLEYCIKYRHDLLCGRHLDQIVMCSLYAICRVIDKEVKFKVIVAAYQKLPHKPDIGIYKRVVMRSPSTTAPIISFYNEIYMQTMKAYLLQFSPERRPPSSPAPRPGHSPHKVSPLRISENVTISPLRYGDMQRVQMTPGASRLYCFNSVEGMKPLQPMNDVSIQALPASVAATKRLRFDEPSDS